MEDSKSEPGTSEDQTLKSVYKVRIMTTTIFINLFVVIPIHFFALFFCHFLFWCTLYQTPDGVIHEEFLLVSTFCFSERRNDRCERSHHGSLVWGKNNGHIFGRWNWSVFHSVSCGFWWVRHKYITLFLDRPFYTKQPLNNRSVLPSKVQIHQSVRY